MNLSFENIIRLLQSQGSEKIALFEKAAKVKHLSVGDKVYFRGLIEFSNICIKDCHYCGIRQSNYNVQRYNLSDMEILNVARFAYENRYSSIVLQSGEIQSKSFSSRITSLLDKITLATSNNLRITLSCGEQDEATYREWFEHGATRYLLRIETSDRGLYQKLHPTDPLHTFDKRLQCLEALKFIGYQNGTGVMIGIPFQSVDQLANDLLWMKDMDIDMVGMGPYIEHKETPLYQYSGDLFPLKDRFELTLKMIAILRLMMPDINIVAATALQAIDKMGREKAIKVGANIVMPNITPGKYRDSYKLYENKPCIDENPEDCQSCLEWRIGLTGSKIAWSEWGDSIHYQQKKHGHVVENGLMDGEEIVTQGAFSVDASAQLEGKHSIMNPSGGKLSSMPGMVMPGDPKPEDTKSLPATKTTNDTKPATDNSMPGMDMQATPKPGKNKPLTTNTSDLSAKHSAFGVSGKCEMCKARIEEAAQSVKGVSSAVWDVKTKKINVEYNDKLTNPVAIQKAIAMVGHDTEKFRADTKTYNALPDCCKYRKL